MRHHHVLTTLVAAACLMTASLPANEPKVEKFDDKGFVAIFDGKTLNGWHVSSQTGHSRGLKEGAQRQLYLESVDDARSYSGSQEGMPSQCEEIVVYTDALTIEYLCPDVGERLFGRIARGNKSGP